MNSNVAINGERVGRTRSAFLPGCRAIFLVGLAAVASTVAAVALDAARGQAEPPAPQAAHPLPTRDPTRLWCAEHGVYEDECTICHPELAGTSGAKEAAAFCKEHRVPEAECGICHSELAAEMAPGQSLKVRLPSPSSARLAGIETLDAPRGSIGAGVDCYAELAFDQNRLAYVATPVGGIVHGVEVDLGSRVEEGAILGSIWSGTIAEAKAAFQRAAAEAALRRQALERERRLRSARVSSERELEEAVAAGRSARAALQEARQQLVTLGFAEAAIEALDSDSAQTPVLELRAPLGGEIIERSAVRGEVVEAGRSLFTVADLSVMWAMLNIAETDLSRVRVDEPVEIALDAVPGRTFRGTLTWVAPEVDERTRLARARAEVPNPDGTLRARTFGRARILTRTAEATVVLPASAVQLLDGRPWVFVRAEEDLYDARPVRLGARHQGRIQVLDGVRPGEPVAVSGAFVLKSELLKSRLGAGCVDD